MRQVEIEGADLRELVERARSGEEIVLVDGGCELARLVSAAQSTDEEQRPRQLGLAGERWKVPDDFDAPLPDDLLDLFERGPLLPGDPPLWPVTPESTQTRRR